MQNPFDEQRLDAGLMASFAAMAEDAPKPPLQQGGDLPVYFFERSNVPVGAARMDFHGAFAIGETVITKDGHPVEAVLSVDFDEGGQPEAARIEFPVQVNEAIKGVFEKAFDAECDEGMRAFALPIAAFLDFADSERWSDWESLMGEDELPELS